MLIGIVGKPNVGKSTFFKAATLAEVAIAPIPFTTIKPNEGVGYVKVPCPEIYFNVKCNPRQGFCIDGQRFVPIKLMDVAGLVPGAHLGKGLGNKFLSDLIQADVLMHIVDASGSTDEEGKIMPYGSYDPAKDIQFIENEIEKWFVGLLKENWAKFVRYTQQEKEIDKALAKQFFGFKITLDQVKIALKETSLEEKKLQNWSDEDLHKFASKLRLLSKPIIIAANKIDLPTSKETIERLKREFPNYLIVPCSAESELALREAAKKGLIKYVPGDSYFSIQKERTLTDSQKKALDLIKQKILDVWGSTGVQDCLNKAVFDFLKWIVVFPGGVHKLADSQGRILPDAFLLPPDSTPLDFAAKIHSDFAKNFIAAINVKTKQKIGKDARLQNLDVIEIIAGK
ncbi:MAG: redox-regulated ATPase YchF [Candidatus Nanoarchaeia archaeon]